MAEIVKGLFGIDPQGYQEQQLANQRAEAIQYAKLDPFQKATVGMYQGVQQGIGAGLNMMGVQDPDLQAQQIASKLATNYDMNDPASLQQFRLALQAEAQNTGNGKLSEFASMVGSKIMQIQATGADIGLKQAQAVKALREPDAGVAALIGKSTPESVAAYKKSGNLADLQLAEKPERMGDGTIKEIAGAEKINSILTSTNKGLDSWLDKIDNNKVVFGLGERAKQIAENQMGGDAVSANTLELNSLEKFIERERNNILLAAKGTQTEGDAERALNQIIKRTDMNSPASVRQALEDLKAYKKEQLAANNVYIDSLRGTKKINSEKPSAPKEPSSPTAGTSPSDNALRADYEKWKAKHKQDNVPFEVYVQARKARQAPQQ
jgi:hypothetical protein